MTFVTRRIWARALARRCWTLPLLLGATRFPIAPLFAQEAAQSAERPALTPIPGLDAYVSSTIKSWDAPGLALVIVRGDSVLARGYGVREIGGADSVDAETLFPIGSLTKAFTATVIAALVDDRTIAWDDPVVRHLPEFRMFDSAATGRVTIRDVLSHRSGLPGGDLIWAGGAVDASEVVRRLRFQQPAFDLRAGYRYTNEAYLLVGELAARVAGKPWSQLVRERILMPLGMDRSTVSLEQLRDRMNVAMPHDETGPGQLLGSVPRAGASLEAPTRVRRIEWFEVPTTAAGGIASSAAEFAHWLRFQLGSGDVDGRRIIGERALLETRTPQFPIPGFPGNQSEASETNLNSTGMGWAVRDYRGRLMVTHLGSTPGWGSAVALLPAQRTAVAVFVNISQGLWPANSVMRFVLDRVLGAESREWNAQPLASAEQRRRAQVAALHKAVTERPTATKPVLPLAAYAGTYVESAHPPVRVTYWKGNLRLSMGPMLSGDIDHWYNDTFRVTWDRADFGANLVTFHAAGTRPDSVHVRILGQSATWRRTERPPGEVSTRVIPPGDPGSWDARYMYGPYILRRGDTWYMFYTGAGPHGSAIGFATSLDGVRWTKSPANPVFALSAYVGVPVVYVRDDGTWVILHERTPRGRAIYRATAPGPTGPWTPDPQPILESRDSLWDRLMFPESVARVGREWRLYYTGRSAIAEAPREALPRLGVATSADSRTWRLHDNLATTRAPYLGSDPILAEGAAGRWDEHGIAASNPIRTQRGWELFYVGFPRPLLSPATPERGTLWLGHATSTDGLHWTKTTARPLVDTGELQFPLTHLVQDDGQYLVYHDWRFGEGIGLIRIAAGRIP
ncbi:MAG: serine hydrolase [Gemmatimonadaceae bacterium]